MLTMPSLKKSLIVEQFQRNYLNADLVTTVTSQMKFNIERRQQ